MLSIVLAACSTTGQSGSIEKVLKKKHGEGLFAAINTNKGSIIIALMFCLNRSFNKIMLEHQGNSQSGLSNL